jgi:hypothetical protein
LKVRGGRRPAGTLVSTSAWARALVLVSVLGPAALSVQCRPNGPPTAKDAGPPPRDGGCLPCPSRFQRACKGEISAGATCTDPGAACCDGGDRFWLCRCQRRGDADRACVWTNVCGG